LKAEELLVIEHMRLRLIVIKQNDEIVTTLKKEEEEEPHKYEGLEADCDTTAPYQ
jgi:hypothetical protein